MRPVDAQHKEGDALLDQSVHTEPMSALWRIERFEVGLQLIEQSDCIRSIGDALL